MAFDPADPPKFTEEQIIHIVVRVWDVAGNVSEEKARDIVLDLSLIHIYGGHGRAQLVSDIAHEAAAGLVDFFQAAGHGVKGLGQLGQLIVALHGHAGGKISAAELFRCV